MVRTDASGTTQQVTEYLAADPAAWQLGAGKTVGWPKCVVTVQGSDGVVAYTAANALSIGRAARARAAGQRGLGRCLSDAPPPPLLLLPLRLTPGAGAACSGPTAGGSSCDGQWRPV